MSHLSSGSRLLGGRSSETVVTYFVFKIIHILGVIILVGNVTVTFIWKVYADRTRDPSVVAFAQRLVTWTDCAFTAGGALLIIVGGYGMIVVADLDPIGVGWLFWSQVWFYGIGLVWLFVLIPLQIQQARLVRQFAGTGTIPESYWRLCRYWNIVGIASTTPVVYVLYLMIARP